MNRSSCIRPALEMVRASIPSSARSAEAVIHEVNWEVAPGELWVVCGLPGSGKSDLLLSAAGLAPLLRGQMRWFGQEYNALAEEEKLKLRQRVGIVFEGDGRLFCQMTVAENLALPFCYHRNAPWEAVEERLNAALAVAELNEFAGALPGAMPRNLRQRVALARALMLEPDLLLLDNPLKGLDPRQSRWWLSFLERLRERRAASPLTMVVTTDHLDPWWEQPARFAVIHRQRWHCAGEREKLEACEETLWREMLAQR